MSTNRVIFYILYQPNFHKWLLNDGVLTKFIYFLFVVSMLVFLKLTHYKIKLMMFFITTFTFLAFFPQNEFVRKKLNQQNFSFANFLKYLCSVKTNSKVFNSSYGCTPKNFIKSHVEPLDGRKVWFFHNKLQAELFWYSI